MADMKKQNDQNQNVPVRQAGQPVQQGRTEVLPARQNREMYRSPFQLMRELLRDPFGAMTPFVGEQMFVPQFEVRETDDGFLFKADLPGVKKEEIDIQLVGNRLAISGRRNQESEEREGDTIYAYERSYGTFNRVFTLPDNVDLEHIRSELKDGVLTLMVPKKPGQQPRKIVVGGGSKS